MSERRQEQMNREKQEDCDVNEGVRWAFIKEGKQFFIVPPRGFKVIAELESDYYGDHQRGADKEVYVAIPDKETISPNLSDIVLSHGDHGANWYLNLSKILPLGSKIGTIGGKRINGEIEWSVDWEELSEDLDL